MEGVFVIRDPAPPDPALKSTEIRGKLLKSFRVFFICVLNDMNHHRLREEAEIANTKNGRWTEQQHSGLQHMVAGVHSCLFLSYLLLVTLYEELLACQQKLLEKQIVIISYPGNFEQLVA